MCTTLVPSTRWHQWSIQLIKNFFEYWLIHKKSMHLELQDYCKVNVCCMCCVGKPKEKERKVIATMYVFFIQSAIHVKVQDDKSSLLLVVSSIFIIIVVCGL